MCPSGLYKEAGRFVGRSVEEPWAEEVDFCSKDNHVAWNMSLHLSGLRFFTCKMKVWDVGSLSPFLS